MDKRQIINIINFIRSIEPRGPVDLLEPVKEQIALMKKHNLNGTFLVQYDALCSPQFTEILSNLNPEQFEIGVWLEIVQPQAEKAGLKWRGRYPWDWHAHCGFSVGYTPKERELLIDILFEDFKECFGYYPKSLGSWAFDAHSLNYANEKYGLDAACNCKEQWGTDGYNLWGGYYGQGYYPSKDNAFCPAQTLAKQINTPVFRMLGSDPICQYDSGLDIERTGDLCVQGVFTLEPVYTEDSAGGIPAWVDWYFSQNFSGNCVTFGYTQAGQENSFGWPAMKDGLEYQFEKIAQMTEAGILEAETLGNTGRWYKNTFSQTPPSSIVALKDYKEDERRSVWYNCKNYRLNIYAEHKRFWIRDIYVFNEDYKERYLNEICTSNDLMYDNIPFIDGNRFSGGGVRGGLYPAQDENSPLQGMPYSDIIYTEENQTVIVTFTGTPCGDMTFTLGETGFTVKARTSSFVLIPAYNKSSPGLPSITQISETELEIDYRKSKCAIKLIDGIIKNNINCQYIMKPKERQISIFLKNKGD